MTSQARASNRLWPVVAALVLLASLGPRLKVSLATNVANLYYLRHIVSGPDLDACAASAEWLWQATRWSRPPRSFNLEKGMLAWEQGDIITAVDHMYGAYAVDARLARYVRGQEQVTDALPLAKALAAEPYGIETQIACLHVAIRADDHETVALAYRSLVDAWPAWDQRAELWPEPLSRTYSQIGGSFFLLGAYEESLDAYLAARPLVAGDRLLAIDGMIGLCYDRLDRWPEAEAYLRRAENDFFAAIAWGDGAMAQERWSTAILAYERAASLRPDDLRPWRGLERAYAEHGQPEMAASAQVEIDRIQGQTQ